MYSENKRIMEKMFLQVEKLQADVECLRKENETLRFLLGVMSSKYNVLQAHLQERNAEQTGLISLTGGSGSDNETNKRPRTEVPTPNKTSRIFVRTDPKDNSLVSLLIFAARALAI